MSQFDGTARNKWEAEPETPKLKSAFFSHSHEITGDKTLVQRCRVVNDSRYLLLLEDDYNRETYAA